MCGTHEDLRKPWIGYKFSLQDALALPVTNSEMISRLRASPDEPRHQILLKVHIPNLLFERTEIFATQNLASTYLHALGSLVHMCRYS